MTLAGRNASALAALAGELGELRRLQTEIEAAESSGAVPRSLLEGISLIGSKSHVAERLAAYKEAGVTTLNVQPLAHTHAERVRLIEQIKAMAG